MTDSVLDEFQIDIDLWNPQDFCKESYIGINCKFQFICGKMDYEKCLREQCQWDLWNHDKISKIRPKGLLKFLQ